MPLTQGKVENKLYSTIGETDFNFYVGTSIYWFHYNIVASRSKWVNVSCGGITYQLSSRRHVTGKLVIGPDSPLKMDFSGETGKAWSLNLLFHFLLLCLPYLGHRLSLKIYNNPHLLKKFLLFKVCFLIIKCI